eukprot:SAG11_NODE_30477_length_300_cov_1.522388_1_plen_40_part_10
MSTKPVSSNALKAQYSQSYGHSYGYGLKGNNTYYGKSGYS